MKARQHCLLRRSLGTDCAYQATYNLYSTIPPLTLICQFYHIFLYTFIYLITLPHISKEEIYETA